MSVVLLSLLLVPPPARAQEAELEYKLKAAFLYNFLKMNEWPAHKYTPPQPAMIVACLEDDPAAPALARALEARTLGGRPIKFVTLRDTDDWRHCHLLFLSRARKTTVEDLLARLKNAPVLTVSEVDGFAQRGGMINFVRHERTFRFEVNLEAAERAKLRLSSDLSNMATVVKTQPAK